MPVIIRIPGQLRTLTQGVSEVSVEGSTVGEALSGLEAAHPGVSERFLDESGNIRRSVNIFLADEDVRFLQGLETAISGGQTISILPAAAGG